MCPGNLAITEVNLCSHILSLSLHLEKKQNLFVSLHCQVGRTVKNNEIMHYAAQISAMSK